VAVEAKDRTRNGEDPARHPVQRPKAVADGADELRGARFANRRSLKLEGAVWRSVAGLDDGAVWRAQRWRVVLIIGHAKRVTPQFTNRYCRSMQDADTNLYGSITTSL
jgi:hypothetical protein